MPDLGEQHGEVAAKKRPGRAKHGHDWPFAVRDGGWPDCWCGNRVGTIGYRDPEGEVVCHECMRDFTAKDDL